MALESEAVRRGVVVLIRLPRDKARPAVVVRSDLLAELFYATVLPITSELRPGISLRIDVAPTAENGLRTASQVMVDWPHTVRFSDMGAAIGQLDAATMFLAHLATSRGMALEEWWGAGTAPLLVIQGLDDEAAPPRNGHALREQFGERVRVIDLPRAGHFLLLEQPEAVTHAVAAFVGVGAGPR